MPVVVNDRCLEQLVVFVTRWCTTTDAGCQSAQNCDGPAVAAHLTRWSMSLLAQFIDGSHVLVIMQRRLYSGSASDSVITGDSGHSSCATEKGTRLAAVLVMAR